MSKTQTATFPPCAGEPAGTTQCNTINEIRYRHLEQLSTMNLRHYTNQILRYAVVREQPTLTNTREGLHCYAYERGFQEKKHPGSY